MSCFGQIWCQERGHYILPSSVLSAYRLSLLSEVLLLGCEGHWKWRQEVSKQRQRLKPIHSFAAIMKYHRLGGLEDPSLPLSVSI